MKRSAGGRARAVITVYLSLILLLVLTLICALCESGRVSALSSKLDSVTYMAADSLFSEFAQPIFDDYGILLLWKSGSDVTDELKVYIEENLSLPGASKASGTTNLYDASLEDVSLSDLTMITDDGGELFAEQAVQYMKYFLAEDAAEKILSNVDIFEGSDAVSEFTEKINDFHKTFEKVEDAVASVKETVTKVKNTVFDPSSLLEELSLRLSEYSEGSEDAAGGFKSAYDDLKKQYEELKTNLEEIKSKTAEYTEAAGKAEEAIEELSGSLEGQDTSSEVYGILKEQLDEVDKKSANTDADYYGVQSNEEKTDSLLSKLCGLDGFFENYGSDLSQCDGASLSAVLSEYKKAFADFDLSSLNIYFENASPEEESDDFIDVISDLFSDGILSLVAESVSEKTIETQALPSNTVMTGSDTENEGENLSGESESSDTNLISAGTDRALFSEYVLSQFGNYTNVSDNAALDYEAEYILFGNASDKENLTSAVNRIVLLRTGCNMISLYKSSSMRNEVKTLATLCAGAAGPLIVFLTELLIIAAWSGAEAYCDVKTLLSGGKVKTIKSDSDWQLSLDGVKNFSKESISSESSESSESGLGYEGYLRILLLMQNEKTQYFRAMDVIQANMCANENSEFRMAEGICGVLFTAQYGASRLFTGLPFVKSTVTAEGGRYAFSFSREYAYLES